MSLVPMTSLWAGPLVVGGVGGDARADVTTMLLAMRGEHGRWPVELTLLVGEQVHRALVALAASGGRIDCPELTGHDAAGRPLLSDHQHLHIFPLDLDGDRWLDHLLLHCPMGLGTLARESIARLSWLEFGGWPAQRLELIGSGHRDGMAPVGGPMRQRYLAWCGPEWGARHWTSLTPFRAPRFIKPRGRNSLEGQVIEELTSRGFPRPLRVGTLAFQSPEGAVPYAVRRQHGGRRGAQAALFGLSVEFEQPVRGPISLGYGSHFGLGVLQVSESAEV